MIAGGSPAGTPAQPDAGTAADQPRVSVVIVSYNARDHLAACLRALQAHAGVEHETIVIDNNSSDASRDVVRQTLPSARLVPNDRNAGFAVACNQGIVASRSPYVLLLNSDAELQPGTLPHLVDVLDERADVAAVGPRTLNSDGTPQLSWGPALSTFSEWRQRRKVRAVRARRPDALRLVEAEAREEREPDWVSASCLLTRRAALAEVKGFDEAFFLYEEDVDLCVRLRRQGWKVVYTPGGKVVHHLGRSTAKASRQSYLAYQRSHLYYYYKHCGRLATTLLRLHLITSGMLMRLRRRSGDADAELGRALVNLGLRGK